MKAIDAQISQVPWEHSPREDNFIESSTGESTISEIFTPVVVQVFSIY